MAVDSKGKYEGQGTRSCGEWVKDSKGADVVAIWNNVADVNWITGYITAYNTQTPDVYNILGNTDVESVRLWMDKYCQENPLSNLAKGMESLTKELWPNRKRTADD